MKETNPRLLQRMETPEFSVKPAQYSHDITIRYLKMLDSNPKLLSEILQQYKKLWQPSSREYKRLKQPIEVGGVLLNNPLILAAGMIKSKGFASEEEAMKAVLAGDNIIPGWRSVPALVGAVEIGTFTLSPRMGNTGTLIWKDAENGTLYNRVGLSNSGARASATYLSETQTEMPDIYGISIAADPDTTNIQEKCENVSEAVNHFVLEGLRPKWITLNLSCPNVSSDVYLSETPDSIKILCDTLREELPDDIALWTKIEPELSKSAYLEMFHAIKEAGVEAIIACNTAIRTIPSETDLQAGMSGKMLAPESLRAVKILSDVVSDTETDSVDIIACGGILDGKDFVEFENAGAKAVQYWSAVIFRGFNVVSMILQEADESRLCQRMSIF